MNVLILGGNGILGPHVVKALEAHHTLRITDVKALEKTKHEFRSVDMSSIAEVMDAAEGMDAIINCSVLREHRKIAFDVNARGCYNMMRAAVQHDIKRVINTGPHFTIAGPSYENYDFMINEQIPPHAGTGLYALTKSLGQETCKVFAENHELYVVCLLFYGLKHHEHADFYPGRELTPLVVSLREAADACRLAREIELTVLPSKNEIFYIFTDLPHGKFSNEKAKEILGFLPKDKFEVVWHKLEEQRT